MTWIFNILLAVGSAILLLNLTALWTATLNPDAWTIVYGMILIIIGSIGKERTR